MWDGSPRHVTYRKNARKKNKMKKIQKKTEVKKVTLKAGDLAEFDSIDKIWGFGSISNLIHRSKVSYTRQKRRRKK